MAGSHYSGKHSKTEGGKSRIQGMLEIRSFASEHEERHLSRVEREKVFCPGSREDRSHLNLLSLPLLPPLLKVKATEALSIQNSTADREDRPGTYVGPFPLASLEAQSKKGPDRRSQGEAYVISDH